MGQCSHMMRTKLRGNENFERVELSSDVVELLNMVGGRQYDAIDESKKRYYNYMQ